MHRFCPSGARGESWGALGSPPLLSPHCCDGGHFKRGSGDSPVPSSPHPRVHPAPLTHSSPPAPRRGDLGPSPAAGDRVSPTPLTKTFEARLELCGEKCLIYDMSQLRSSAKMDKRYRLTSPRQLAVPIMDLLPGRGRQGWLY